MTATRAITPGDMVPDEMLVPGDSVGECFDKYLGKVDFLNLCNWGEADLFGNSVSGLNEKPMRESGKEISTAADFTGILRIFWGRCMKNMTLKISFLSRMRLLFKPRTGWPYVGLREARG